MKILASVLLTLLLAPSAVFAKNIYTQCGIGAMIFSKTGWAAAISNIIWDLGTTASSTTTTSPSQCAGSGASAAKIIHENYTQIEEEVSTGEGQHLTAALNVLGCQQSVHSKIISDLRSGLSERVNQNDYSEKNQVQKSEAFFYDLIQKVDSQYANHCTLS